jgi:hypothetical protein
MLGQQIAKKDSSTESWTCRLPLHKDAVLPSIDVNEYGLWVRAVIENQAVQDDSRPVLTVGEWVTMDRIMTTIEKCESTTLPEEMFVV